MKSSIKKIIGGIPIFCSTEFNKKYDKLHILQKNKYTIVSIYLNTLDDTYVAVKTIKINKNYTKDVVYNEIKMQNKIKDDNILYIKEIYSNKKRNIFKIVTDYSQEGDLLDFIIKNKIDDLCKKDFIRQISNIVNLLHKNNIVHCDIKPENFIVCKINEKYILKIIDFGYSHLGYKKTIHGTFLYQSPEQLLYGMSNKCSDIWSMGILFYAIITKKLAFSHGESREKTINKIKKGKYSKKIIKDKLTLDLIDKMICVDKFKRITIKDILLHPYLA